MPAGLTRSGAYTNKIDAITRLSEGAIRIDMSEDNVRRFTAERRYEVHETDATETAWLAVPTA
jgi:hypothetical protein